MIKNPLFQPPKPVTLNANYSKLIPTLSSTVKPPKLSMSLDDLNKWCDDIKLQKPIFDPTSEENQSDINVFKDWVSKTKTQVAPGFDSVIQPMAAKSPISDSDNSKEVTSQTVNNLENILANTNLND